LKPDLNHATAVTERPFPAFKKQPLARSHRVD
jgi:hypothetical protein